MIFLFLLSLLLFAKAGSSRTTLGTGARGMRFRGSRGGVRGSLGTTGARAPRTTREGNITMSVERGKGRFALTPTLSVYPGLVKRVTRARNPLQTQGTARRPRYVSERSIAPLLGAGERNSDYSESDN